MFHPVDGRKSSFDRSFEPYSNVGLLRSLQSLWLIDSVVYLTRMSWWMIDLRREYFLHLFVLFFFFSIWLIPYWQFRIINRYIFLDFHTRRARSLQITSSGSTTICCWIFNRSVTESKLKRTTAVERTANWRLRMPTSRIRAITPAARLAASPTPSTSKFWPVSRWICNFNTIHLLALFIALESLYTKRQENISSSNSYLLSEDRAELVCLNQLMCWKC